MTCRAWDHYADRRCRNKAVTALPGVKTHQGEEHRLCRKHAQAQAGEILREHAVLVWALRQAGYLNEPGDGQ